MKIRFVFALLFIQPICIYAQPSIKKGFLFPAADLIEGSEGTYIIFSKIDTALGIQDNLKMLEGDTLLLVSWAKSLKVDIDYDTLINEEVKGRPFRVSAVEVTVGAWMVRAYAPFIKPFEPLSIKFSGRKIVTGCSSDSYFISSLRVLLLPK